MKEFFQKKLSKIILIGLLAIIVMLSGCTKKDEVYYDIPVNCYHPEGSSGSCGTPLFEWMMKHCEPVYSMSSEDGGVIAFFRCYNIFLGE